MFSRIALAENVFSVACFWLTPFVCCVGAIAPQSGCSGGASPSGSGTWATFNTIETRL